jgi:hypothetical protein
MTKKKTIAALDKVAEIFGAVSEAFQNIQQGLDDDDKETIENGIDQLPHTKAIQGALKACGELIDEKPWTEWLDEISEDASA